MTGEPCKRCGEPIPAGKKNNAVYCSANCCKRAVDEAGRGTCRDCGGSLHARSKWSNNGRLPAQCDPCRRDAERDVRDRRRDDIAQRWNAGETLSQIAAALGSTPNSIGVTLVHMRADGWDLAYHYPANRAKAAA